MKQRQITGLRPPRQSKSGSEAGRVLAELSCLSERERYRARARLMREAAGLPPHPLLEPRGKR